MALFNRLFFPSSCKKKTNSSLKPSNFCQFPFESKQVRILLYRECDSRGRKLLFDSNAIEVISASNLNENQHSYEKKPIKMNCKFSDKKTEFIEITNEYGYRHANSKFKDISSLGEMIFGALAMSFRGTSLKVHWLESPSRILCSQVFLSPVLTSKVHQHYTYSSSMGEPIKSRSFQRSSISSETSSFEGYSISSFSKLLNTTGMTNSVELTDVALSKTESDSGYSQWQQSLNQYSTSTSTSDQIDSLRKLSLDSATGSFGFSSQSFSGLNSEKSSDSSIQRRIKRNYLISFENHSSSSDFIGFIGDNYPTTTGGGSDECVGSRRMPSDSCESRSNPEMIRPFKSNSGEALLQVGNSKAKNSRRAKLGLAVCITISDSCEKEMEQFFCEHIALIETMLCRLRFSAETAYLNKNKFMKIMLDACQSTTQFILDLFTAPRLPDPVWLNLNFQEQNNNSKKIAENFIKELCWLLKNADTKDTNFFISTILTAILTHHLGWVSTITSKKIPYKEKFKEISSRFPYNPLWAQIGDLFGAIGNPTKIARTIIYGKEANLIEKLLYILTYFIRCAQVKRCHKTELFNENELTKILSNNYSQFSTEALSPKKRLGLVKNKTFNKNLNEIDSAIKLTLTTPDNIEFPVVKNISNEILTNDDVTEAIEINNVAKQASNINFAKNIFLSLKPKWNHIQMGVKVSNEKSGKQTNNFTENNNNIISEVSKNPSYFDHKYQYSCHKDLETLNVNSTTHINEIKSEETFSKRNLNKNEKESVQIGENLKNVVFVLGDNDTLVNLKKSTDDIVSLSTEDTNLNSDEITTEKKSKFQHHHCHKKHSGVKFNFEEYPKIATNYMKNKNIDLFDEFQSEKSKLIPCSSKIFQEEGLFKTATLEKSKSIDENCEYCMANSNKLYQTPSNATELEFETSNSNSEDSKLNFNKLKSSTSYLPKISEKEKKPISQRGMNLKKIFQNSKNLNIKKCDLNLTQLPLPEVADANNNQILNANDTTGFIPSLLLGVNDHYIPDMVLQGTTKSPNTWETNLKNDLTISSHCASLISLPTENIAILADMQSWEVKIISSQTNMLPFISANCCPVGMSQLVSQMLETLCTISNCGFSAYECLSFIELKLQELYIHSEALASFLLTTEFCTLNTVTNSLNLTENDIPLLLSVASIHSPSVTKRYGISFR